MPVMANPARVREQLAAIDEMADEAPVPLAPVMQGLRFMVAAALRDSTSPERPLVRPMRDCPGGVWRVSRFTAYGQPWAGLEWPSEVVGGSLIDWLRMTTARNGVSAQRPDVPSNQLWVHLGSR